MKSAVDRCGAAAVAARAGCGGSPAARRAACVGHRVEHRAYDALGRRRRRGRRAPGPGRAARAGPRRRRRGGRAASGRRLVGLELAGGDQAHAEQRGAGEQRRRSGAASSRRVRLGRAPAARPRIGRLTVRRLVGELDRRRRGAARPRGRSAGPVTGTKLTHDLPRSPAVAGDPQPNARHRRGVPARCVPAAASVVPMSILDAPLARLDGTPGTLRDLTGGTPGAAGQRGQQVRPDPAVHRARGAARGVRRPRASPSSACRATSSAARSPARRRRSRSSAPRRTA